MTQPTGLGAYRGVYAAYAEFQKKHPEMSHDELQKAFRLYWAELTGAQ